MSWIQTSAPLNYWRSIASSTDGKFVVACSYSDISYNGGIYTSTNFGYSWSLSTSQTGRWESVACSGTGQYIVAVAGYTLIYVSSNSGSTWTSYGTSVPNWFSVTCSTSGQYMTAVWIGGTNYTSSNYGTTWIPNASSGPGWRCITSSSSGQYQAIGTNIDENIYTSTNYGSTWTQQTNSPTKSWRGIASNSTGQYIVACATGDYIYRSTNFGSTWTQTLDISAAWISVGSNSTGTYLVAAISNGGIYTSSNSGSTWIQTNAPSINWVSIASSSNGNNLAAVSIDRGIYINKQNTNIYVNNVDITNFVFPYISGIQPVTRYYVNGVDIGSIFQPNSYTVSPFNTGINIAGQDLRNLITQNLPTVTGTYVMSSLNNYTLFSFISGTSTITFPSTISANVLLVAGGGAGGNIADSGWEGGGGGGGGGVGYGSLSFTGGVTYTITVGQGGSMLSRNGGNSYITGASIYELAIGGGAGGSGQDPNNDLRIGSNGGSGGGGNGYAGGHPGGSAITEPGTTLTYIGNSGGFGSSNGGGGGGATTEGSTGTNVSGSGVGGDGYTWDINSVTYAGGGGGGSKNDLTSGGLGGSGGGANGGDPSSNGFSAANNTGGGGGGAGGTGGTDNYTGGNGGSGIVIIGYSGPLPIPTPPNYITTFNLSFSSTTVPTVDLCGNQLTNNNSLVIQSDPSRGFVAYMSAINKSFSTNYATPSNFTRAFWYNPTSITTGRNNTLSSNNLRINFNSNLLTATFNVVSGQQSTISDTTNRGTGTWTHYALTYNVSIATATLYVNGVQVARQSPIYYYGELNTVNTGGLCIGDYNATGVGGQAYFDNIQSFNYALSSAEIYSIVSSTNVRNGLTFSLEFSSTTIPTSDTFNSTITINTTTASPANNSTATIAVDPNRGYVLFTGPAYTKNSLSTNYATPSKFTRSFWAYFTGPGNYSDCCLGSTTFFILNVTFQNSFSVQLNKGTGQQVNINSTLIPRNEWRHIAVTYDGLTCAVYMNGSFLNSGTGTYTGDSGTVNAGGLCIGDYNNGGYTSNGLYDQIRCYNRALSAAEVSQIYKIENNKQLAITRSYLLPANMFYAFSVRRLVSSYTGPVFTIRRSSDNASSDFYTDGTQSYLTTGPNNTGTTYVSWISGTGYVTRWYDQSGRGNHANQTTVAYQPTLSLQTSVSVNKYVINFANSSTNTYLTLTTGQSNLTVFAQYYNIDASEATILSAAMNTNFGVRVARMIGGTTNDWYFSGGATKNAYNNGYSVSSFTINSWNSLAASISSYSTTSPQAPLVNIGTDAMSFSNGLKGYMSELIGHNSAYISNPTSTIKSDFATFYINRLF